MPWPSRGEGSAAPSTNLFARKSAMKPFKITAVLLALAFAGTAQAQDDVITTSGTNWEGFYIGGNIGGVWYHTCSTWEPGNIIKSTPVLANAFYNRDCPSNGTFIGGIQIGYNFQYDNWVWGFGLDYEFYGGKDRHRAFAYNGASPPPDGTYSFSGKGEPDGFLVLGPRIGYAIDRWSRRAEYTYVNLGKGNNDVTHCTGSATTCARFGNLELDNIHNSVTASLFRVGINYRF